MHLDTIADADGMSLANVSALATRVIDGRIVVFAASAPGDGISHFVIPPGRIGQTRHVDQGRHVGTDGNDLIQGGLNTTRIEGGAGDDKLRSERDYLGKAIEDVQGMVENLAMTAMGSMDPKNDPKTIYKVGLNTTRFLLSAGDLVIGWLLLRQAEIAQARLDAGDAGKDEAFYTGKVAAAKFFAANVLPRLTAERAMLESTDLSLMELPEEAF